MRGRQPALTTAAVIRDRNGHSLIGPQLPGGGGTFTLRSRLPSPPFPPEESCDVFHRAPKDFPALIAVMAAGVFQCGLLADSRPGAPHGYRTAVPSALAGRLRAFRLVCERYAVPPRAVALQFPIAHPAVATVVVGARKPDEATDNARLFSHPIPQALWTDLKTAGILPSSASTP